MGAPRLDWQEIPLAEAMDTLHVPASVGWLKDAVCVSMGNPHAVYFVDDADTVNLAQAGRALEHHPLFPQRANISIAQIVSRERIRLRVWERGAGLTLACGTAACAALVAANRRALTGTKAEVELPGGVLTVEWRDGRVWMTGPVAEVFAGELALD
jgi:diaminopimelate epimerase